MKDAVQKLSRDVRGTFEGRASLKRLLNLDAPKKGVELLPTDNRRSTPPGIAPAIALHPQQLDAAARLHEAAACLPRCSRIVVTAGDVQDLLNAYWQESRRADQATARLESLAAAHAAPAPPSAN